MAHIEEAPAAMIDRVASLLESFVGERPLTLAELARRSHVPRSSAHRILQRLVELGWVERKEFTYTLGVRMFELGSQFTRRRTVPRAAVTVMAGLHRRSGLTVYLSMLVGAEIMHLERIGSWPSASGQWSAGARQPVTLTAPGRALLATLSPDRWPELHFDYAPTQYSIQSRSQLMRDLARVRDRGGVAVDAQGTHHGVTVVAAPITTMDDDGHFALSVCGPTRALDLVATTAEVRNAAATVWRVANGVPTLRPRAVPDLPSSGAELQLADGRPASG
ncbi:IclR family transcriptional regulator [Amycolatopsis rubida]|uniref:IclR family transcriptional regulator n=1 Tax=Amycolatopsis rubida TaxID=112413 RepID=A0ABX0BWE8_9PSEU|nr:MULTISPECIES: IclR family transcriptional regulator [Amycolatopsis]MYW93540.1 helix-turn-helix domain-containing protein [Amycolatopsis rubida]NEC58527.1 IclR family transcriptional regulator [Amycolatopsis rubida]OAP25429.1 Transcriptional regulator KdgR [Amycolatopsis sp. M39]